MTSYQGCYHLHVVMLCVCSAIFQNYLHSQCCSLFSPFPNFWLLVFHLKYFAALPVQSDQNWTIHLFQTPSYAFITIYLKRECCVYKLQRLPFQSAMQFRLLCNSVLSFPQT